MYSVHKAYVEEDKEGEESIILELKEEFNSIKSNKKYIIKLPNTIKNEVFVNGIYIYHSRLEMNPKPNENGKFKEIVVRNSIYKLDVDTGDMMFIEDNYPIMMGVLLAAIISLILLITLQDW